MILHPLDADFMLKLRKEKEFEVKVGELGKTQIIRIPALLRDYYHIEKGKIVRIEPKSSTEFTVKVSSDEVRHHVKNRETYQKAREGRKHWHHPKQDRRFSDPIRVRG